MDESVRIAGELAGVTVTMMLIDVISGYVGAWVTKTVSSSRMREGLAHKGMLILLMLMAGLIDWVQQQGLADLGFKVPLLEAACIYIIWMEINSALENAGEIFPWFKRSKLYSMFAAHADPGDAANIEYSFDRLNLLRRTGVRLPNRRTLRTLRHGTLRPFPMTAGACRWASGWWTTHEHDRYVHRADALLVHPGELGLQPG